MLIKNINNTNHVEIELIAKPRNLEAQEPIIGFIPIGMFGPFIQAAMEKCDLEDILFNEYDLRRVELLQVLPEFHFN